MCYYKRYVRQLNHRHNNNKKFHLVRNIIYKHYQCYYAKPHFLNINYH
jgi:hypothetical protein